MLENAKTFSSFSVDDLDATHEFYRQTLGVRVSEETMPEGYRLLNLHLAGGVDVLLYPKPDHTPASFTVLNFLVEDIEAAVKELAARGVVFERYDGTEMETDEQGIFRGGGPLIAWFQDPAGNVLSVIQEE